jgi:hypothetical protein
MRSAHAQARAVAEGHVDHGLEAPHVVIADGALDIAFEPAGRLLGYEEDGAARGIAAEQRALRPLQHLDILQVEEGTRTSAVTGLQRARTARRDHVGEIDADRRGGEEILDETAQREGRIVVAKLTVGRQRRGISGEILAGNNVAISDRLLREHGHGDRNVLKAFLDAASSNDDIIVGDAVGFRGQCRNSAARQRHRNRRQQ